MLRMLGSVDPKWDSFWPEYRNEMGEFRPRFKDSRRCSRMAGRRQESEASQPIGGFLGILGSWRRPEIRRFGRQSWGFFGILRDSGDSLRWWTARSRNGRGRTPAGGDNRERIPKNPPRMPPVLVGITGDSWGF